MISCLLVTLTVCYLQALPALVLLASKISFHFFGYTIIGDAAITRDTNVWEIINIGTSINKDLLHAYGPAELLLPPAVVPTAGHPLEPLNGEGLAVFGPLHLFRSVITILSSPLFGAKKFLDV